MVGPVGIITSVEDVGIPPHQLLATFQSVLVVPNQVPAVHELPDTFRIPVAVDPKYCKFLLVAVDAVLPHEPEGCPIPPRVRVPAEDVNVPRLAITPKAIDKFEVMVVPVPNVFVPLLDKIKLLKVVVTAPPIDCDIPFKFTVLVFAVNVPLFVQLPLTVNKLDPVIVNEAPLLIVIFRLNPPAAPMIG